MESESVVKLSYSSIDRETIVEDIEKAVRYYNESHLKPPAGSFTIMDFAKRIGKKRERARSALRDMDADGIVKLVAVINNRYYYKWVDKKEADNGTKCQ